MKRSGHAPFESIEELDAELARGARADGALRFGLGAGLEALARIAGHHDLGFSTVECYALERCERSARWVQGARSLAHRLETLPRVRSALATGDISFSMAQVLASAACAEDEGFWLAEARQRTVRQMQRLAKERQSDTGRSDTGRISAENRSGDTSNTANDAAEVDAAEVDAAEVDAAEVDAAEVDAAEGLELLSITVDRVDAWLFECARMIVRHVAGMTLAETIEALLGEGTTSLLPDVRRDDVPPFDDAPGDDAQRVWEKELARWREKAEARCEAGITARAARDAGGTEGRAATEGRDATEGRAATEGRDATEGRAATERHATDRAATDDAPGFAFDGDAAAIDVELRRIAGELATRDVALGRLANAFWAADGWRRLGYATAPQYARERLGMSLSCIKAKRRLARRADEMPRLATAIAEREIGYEAARLVASVATTETVTEWVARARERTVRHLREEVDVVEMLGRLGSDSPPVPPSDATMREVASVESRIVSGEAFRGGAGTSQISATLAALLAAFEEARRPSCAARSRGRVTLRLRVSAGTRRYYRWLERLFRRHGPPRVSFLRFSCCSLIDAWRHTLGEDVAYADVYARDRYRCASPVCGRRDVTPHHLRFRSAGGDESAENVASLCVWCHLDGIHGGRLRAAPPASDIGWTIGRTRHTVIRGRKRADGTDSADADVAAPP